MCYTDNAVLVIDRQLSMKRNYPVGIIAEQFAMISGQSVPGNCRARMMRIVETEVERKPVDPVVAERKRVTESVGLFGLPSSKT